MEEEGVIGTNFTVTVEVSADLARSAQSDMLNETVDYVTISEIVQTEMVLYKFIIQLVNIGFRVILFKVQKDKLIGEIDLGLLILFTRICQIII